METEQGFLKDVVIGTAIALLIEGRKIEIKEIDDAQPFLLKRVLRVGQYWYDSSTGEPCTARGEPVKKNSYWMMGKLVPLTGEIEAQIERETLLHKLTGTHRTLWGTLPLLYKASNQQRREIVAQLETPSEAEG